MVINSDCFPTPDLALRSADPGQLHRVRRFATEQAVIAEAMRVRLRKELPRSREHGDRVELLRGVYVDLVEWRYQMALAAAGRLGRGLPLDPARFRLSIREAGANIDRLGSTGRLRIGATWNPHTRTFEGGQLTPASTIMDRYGHIARDRFATEQDNLTDPDVLVNTVTLPNRQATGGQAVNDADVVPGNRLVRGLAAERVAERLLARIQARGGDISQVEVGGDPIYAVTGDHQDADRIFTAALSLLTETFAHSHDNPLRAWQTARYLLYQAPIMKKGSDAVIRVFLVAAGAVMFGTAPVLEHDADLRCMVLGQPAATQMPADTLLHTTIT